MSVLIENIIEKSVASKLPASMLKSINEAIDSEIEKQRKEIEKDTSTKFSHMVEALTSKFSSQVDTAINENVSQKMDSEINTKLTEVVNGMINLLESTGLYNSEKAKELASHLKNANKKLEDAYKEREILREQLDEEKKENTIRERLIGAKPELVASAIEYFKEKDLIDVMDEIDSFVSGDHSNLIIDDSSKFKDGLEEITLDQVEDALSEINSANTEKVVRGGSKLFESLGKGLNPQRGSGVNRSHSFNAKTQTLTESNDPSSIEDTDVALSQIENFRDLGFHFK